MQADRAALRRPPAPLPPVAAGPAAELADDRLIDAIRALAGNLSLAEVRNRIGTAARQLVDARDAALVARTGSPGPGQVAVSGEAGLLDVPVLVHGQLHGILRLRARAAAFSRADASLLAVFAAAAGSALAGARLLDEARRRDRGRAVLLQVANALMRGDEPETALLVITGHVAEILGADTAAVAVPGWPRAGPGGQSAVPGRQGGVPGGQGGVPGWQGVVLRVASAAGQGADELAGMELPAAGSIFGDVQRDGRTALIEDGGQDQRMYPPAARAMNAGPVVIAALPSPAGAGGIVMAGYRAGRQPPGAAALAELDSFAAQAGAVLGHSRQQREQRQLAISESRARIASGLHDSVIRQLSATGLALQGAAQLAGSRALGDRIQRAVDDLDDVIHRIRVTIFGLEAQSASRPSLAAAVLAVTEQLTAAYALSCHLDLDGLAGQGSSAEVTAHFLAVLRDTLADAGSRASATCVDVSLSVRAGQVVLRVTGDGAGNAIPTERRDLLKTAEFRACALGGGLSIGSAAAGGTSVESWIPLPAPNGVPLPTLMA